MKIELTEKSIEKIARRVTDILQEKKPEAEPEYVSCAEAARLLKISTDRMRRLKHLFPHKKVTGKLLFEKRGLGGLS